MQTDLQVTGIQILSECKKRYQESEYRLREDKDPTPVHPTLEGEKRRNQLRS